MFVVLGTISSVVTWLWIPEYAGRTYAQIDELFIRKVPARKFKSFECSGDYGGDLDMMVPQQLA
jgi:SP family general alpha glucoside:H+ symporter-like MFS transporter